MAASDSLHPEQLKMFMTAREIQSAYDPHEGDRMHVGTMTPAHRDLSVTDPRAGELTHRPERTDRAVNKVYPFAAGTYQRSAFRMQVPNRPESNEQMWQRKLNESYVRTVPSQGDRAVSLYEHVQEHGVESPIPLGRHPSRTGKPMVAGGQHRVAVMAHLNPDQLMPVTHVQNVLEAISSKL